MYVCMYVYICTVCMYVLYVCNYGFNPAATAAQYIIMFYLVAGQHRTISGVILQTCFFAARRSSSRREDMFAAEKGLHKCMHTYMHTSFKQQRRRQQVDLPVLGSCFKAGHLLRDSSFNILQVRSA